MLLVIFYKTKENKHASAARFLGGDVIFSKVSFMRSTLPIEILIRFMQPFCIPKQLLRNRYIQPATKTESVDRLQFFMVLCCWGALELIDLLGMWEPTFGLKNALNDCLATLKGKYRPLQN